MAPVRTAGQLQGCALKYLDERALFFQKQNKILPSHLWEKQLGKTNLAWQDWSL